MKKIDPQLKAVLRDFANSYRVKRAQALQGYDFEDLRAALADLKDRALDRNSELLSQFEEKARAHGSVVLRARDGAEADGLILKICRDHGIRRMVKSKSMVSEEIGLNDFLIRRGVDIRETDLGEWIVQLGAERPTHMVMPAIHLTRSDVAALFSAKLGRPIPDDIPSLVRAARGEMRREIFAAQAGLTGANALIADIGAIMLVTNEGNGRLVTTVPPIHIVLASIEKVLPTIGDAMTLLRLLPRNATGQNITSYVSFMAGPHRGPQYVILLDNHRSELLADPPFREILRCVKCSACLNVCPVYQVIGGEAYSYIYMGGIGTLLTAWIHGLRKAKGLAGLCLRCHRCEGSCAAKIKIADLITALAGRLKNETGARAWKRAAFDGVMGHPGIQRAAFETARKARKIIAGKDGFSRRLPAWMKKYDRFRALPAPAPRPFSSVFRKDFVSAGAVKGRAFGSPLARGLYPRASTAERDPGEKPGAPAAVVKPDKGTVTIFGGCLVEHFYPEIGLAAARVLAKLGYRVKVAPALCCGFPPSNAGFEKASRKAFVSLVDRMEIEGKVVTLCPTCATMLTKRGPEIADSERARELAAKTIPFSRFLLDREMESLEKLMRKGRPVQKVTYHDSCHHKHLSNAERASRKLVETALRCDILEMEEPDRCCGFAGSFSVENPEISAALLADKLAAVERTGADIVAMDCPGCLLQIRGGSRRWGMGVRAVHTAELLDQAIGDG
jgi:L-lactate dehydrogenase complex protein LldF